MRGIKTLEEERTKINVSIVTTIFCTMSATLGMWCTYCSRTKKKVKHMVILLFIFYSCKYLFYVLQCLTCFLAWYLNDYYQEWPLYWLGGSYLHIIQHEDKEYIKWCQEISSRKNVRIFVCSNFFPLELFSWPLQVKLSCKPTFNLSGRQTWYISMDRHLKTDAVIWRFDHL